jgi:hypothetical protein
MNLSLQVAMMGALLNIFLMSVVPCLLKNNTKKLSEESKKQYKKFMKPIVMSSVVVALVIYLVMENIMVEDKPIGLKNFLDDPKDFLERTNRMNKITLF